jgi:hypothetical protein
MANLDLKPKSPLSLRGDFYRLGTIEREERKFLNLGTPCI